MLRGHFKAVVTKPQNVLVMRDVACAGYVAGCNTKWLKDADAIQDRLSFSNELDGDYGSMLAFAAHAGQVEAGGIDTTMSVTSRLLPWDVQSGPGGGNTKKSFPGGDSMFQYYADKLQLRQIHFGEDLKAVENSEFISQARVPPHERPAACARCSTTPARARDNRARPTTPRASSARTACTTRSPSRS